MRYGIGPHCIYRDIVKICAVILCSVLPADRSSVHYSPRPWGGNRGRRKQRSAERRRRVSVSKRKSSGSIIWRWFGYKSSDEQQNRTAGVRCAAAVVPALAVARGGSRGGALPQPPRTRRVEEEMVGLDITTINVESNITTAVTLIAALWESRSPNAQTYVTCRISK